MNHMDRKEALKVLGLKGPVSLEQAKKAYRDLAKKYHPDVLGKGAGSPESSESIMKKVNLAFRSLMPYLKSDPDFRKPEKNTGAHDPADARRDMGEHFRARLSAFFKTVLSGFLSTRTGPGATVNPGCGASHSTRPPADPVSFDKVLASVTPRDIINKSKRPQKGQPPARQKTAAYQRYRDYIKIRKQMRSSLKNRSTSSRIEPVEKIDPIAPVNPVTRK